MTKRNRSVESAMAVLEVISEKGPSSLAFPASRTGLSKATLLRIYATPEGQRWVVRRGADARYQLGVGFRAPGQAPKQIDWLVAAGMDVIVGLSEKTGLGADLASAIGNGRVEIVDTTRRFAKHAINPECLGFRPSPF